MAVDCGLLTDLRQIEPLFKKLAVIEDGFGFDIESGYDGPPMPKYSLYPETAHVSGVSFSGHPSWGRYVPLRFRGGQGVNEVEFARLLAVLLGSGMGIAHNLKFELRHLARFFRERLSTAELIEAGLEKDGYYPFFSDSMIEAHLLGIYRSHKLKYLSKELFDSDQMELWDLFPPMTEAMQKCVRFTDLELTPKVVTYACDDASYCLRLSHLHRPQVKDKLLYRVDMGVIPVLARMEDHGILFDWVAMERDKRDAEKFASLMRSEIMVKLTALTGKVIDINLNSSTQVADVLYGQLGMSTTRRTAKSGKMSTDAKALTGLAKKHGVVKKLIEYREMRKLVGSYLAKFPREFRYAKDDRAHPDHKQTLPAGRFAASDPAYQGLPKKYIYTLDSGLEFNLKFRNYVISAPEHYLIGFDYSQIELRVLAGFSGEPALIKAFEDGIDVHIMTASLMFDVVIAEVTEDLRDVGKTQNFATMYGQGANGIAERLGISLAEAQAFMEKYFAVYSSVKSWMDKQTLVSMKNGYTISKFGRIHPLFQLESESAAVRGTGERLCVNAPIQGSAADMMRVAMVRVQAALKKAGLTDRVHLQMNIHDALVWEAHRSVSPQTIIDIAYPQVCFPVPGWPIIRADWELGTKWGSMIKLRLDDNNQIIVPSREPVEEKQLAMAG